MKENFQNNFTKILKSILGIGVVVISIGAGCSNTAYNYQIVSSTVTNPTTSEKNTISFVTSSIDRENAVSTTLAAYQDESLGFSIQYPQNLKATKVGPIADPTKTGGWDVDFYSESSELKLQVEIQQVSMQKLIAEMTNNPFISSSTKYTIELFEINTSGLMAKKVCQNWKSTLDGTQKQACIYYVPSNSPSHLPTYIIFDSTQLQLYKTFKLLPATK
jgi:hypothetical protein